MIRVKSYLPFTLLISVAALVCVAAYQQVELRDLRVRMNAMSSDLASTTDTLSESMRTFSQTVSDLSNQTSGLSNELSTTKQNVGSLNGTLTSLKRLAEADPMLLKKYSKVYFLNENYTPAHLSVISPSYVYSTGRQEQFHSDGLLFLTSLIDAAKQENVEIYVKSAYRSFAEQKSLKSLYSVTYGAGTANSFSADQGYSEHQLGTTVDFVTTGQGGKLDGFDKTAAYAWLTQNAYKYGFILSYPKNNGYYIYEPWHWRYVGIKLATYLHDNNMHFYDMDQRDIDTYLVDMFDWKY